MRIRPDFIRSYAENYARHTQGQYDLLRASDGRTEALNRQYGLPGSSSQLSGMSPEYYEEYRRVRRESQSIWEKYNETFSDWIYESDMTAPEFLFVDNFTSHLSKLCDRPEFDGLFYATFIRLKAQILVEEWKSDFDLGDLRNRIEQEIRLHSYAEKRCKQHFNLYILSFSQLSEIRSYRRFFRTALRETYKRLRL